VNLIVADAVVIIGNLLIALLFLRAIMSWMPFNPSGIGGTVYRILSAITEPLISPVRRLVQRSPISGSGMLIDFSPMLVMLAIFLLTPIITDLLRNM